MTPIKEDSMRLRQAAFCIETIAHLNHLERELLPLADALREIAERAYPTARLSAGVEANEAARSPAGVGAGEAALTGREILLTGQVDAVLSDGTLVDFKTGDSK